MSDKLKFLIDVGVGKKVEKWLFEKGYDIKAIREIDPRMEDDKILDMAVSEKCMLITMDKDFGELVYNSGLSYSGVLLLRLEDANANEKVEVVEKILTQYSDKLLDKFCVFQNGRIRIRE